jgi:flagellar hook-basal body complex protein FliE
MSTGAVQGAYDRSKDLAVDKSDKSEEHSFSDMLQAASDDAIAKVRETDSVLQAGLEGKVETQQLVEAIMALETSVTMAVSVRDKFVAAYQEILRMPI